MAGPARNVLILAGRLGVGEARAIRGLVDRLATLGVTARVACLAGWDGPGGVACPGLGSVWRRPWSARRLGQCEPSWRPELIHAIGAEMAPAALILADGFGIPYLLTIDDFLPPGGRLRLGRRWCRGLIAGGPELAEDLERQLGIPGSWIEVVPAGRVVPERPIGAGPGPVRVVGAAGPMMAGSGLATFLGAACRVVNAGIDAEFVVAGQGRDEADLRRRADRLGIAGRVTFVGDPGADGAFWDVLDVYCQVSQHPDTGRPLATALAHGLPCIATDVVGLRSLVGDGEAGRLVPPGDADALARAILDLLAEPDAARALGLRGRASVARRFEPAREAAALAAHYRRALTLEPHAPAISSNPGKLGEPRAAWRAAVRRS